MVKRQFYVEEYIQIVETMGQKIGASWAGKTYPRNLSLNRRGCELKVL